MDIIYTINYKLYNIMKNKIRKLTENPSALAEGWMNFENYKR
jgi:hypothetical protein